MCACEFQYYDFTFDMWYVLAPERHLKNPGYLKPNCFSLQTKFQVVTFMRSVDSNTPALFPVFTIAPFLRFFLEEADEKNPSSRVPV